MSEKTFEYSVKSGEEELSPEMIQEGLAMLKKQHQIELEEEFKRYDTNGNGVVDRKEFAAHLKVLFGDNVPAFFERMLFALMDENSNGEITFGEFVKYWDWAALFGELNKANSASGRFQPVGDMEEIENLTVEDFKAKLIQKFKLADTDNNGYIDRKEFHDFFAKDSDGEIGPVVERAIFALFDENMDGQISLEEYTKACEKTLVDIFRANN